MIRTNTLSLLMIVLRHEILLGFRRKSEWAILALFFLLVLILPPFVIGPEPEMLRRIWPGMIWIAVALTSLLALEKLFSVDADDGTVDLFILSPLPLSALVATRLLAHGLKLLAMQFVLLPFSSLLAGGVPWPTLATLALSIAIGIPILLSIGGVMAALVLATKRGAAMLLLLLAPFYVPVMVFAISATNAAEAGISPLPHLLLLGAMATISIPLCPFAIATAIKSSAP